MLTERIIQIMDSDNSYPVVSPATLLWGLSKLYGSVMHLRRKLYHHQVLHSRTLSRPVISAGNLALGGTGKTPMVMHLARVIQGMGHRVAIVSRGYKGTAQRKGGIVTDGYATMCRVNQSGDEPYLMAELLERVPIVVGKDRCSAGELAIDRFNPDILLLDDAFQHLRIKRDLDLLLLDARRPVGNLHIFPRGRLREPATAISQADAVVMTRSDHGQAYLKATGINGRLHQKRVFCSRHVGVVRGKAPADEPLPLLEAIGAVKPKLNGMNLFAFSGLANNPSFFSMIKDAGGLLRGTLSFEDHYQYGNEDIDRIAACAIESGAQCLITTDKDYVRLFGRARFPLALIVMGVELDFMDDSDRWESFIKERIHRLIDLRRVA